MESRLLRMSSSSSPFRTFPERDAFPYLSVQPPEVLLHLAKVGEEVARHLHELLEAVLERGVVEQREIAGAHAFDRGVDLVAPLAELGDARLRIRLGALAHLPQQLEQREQA